ncbi:MAG: PIG-L family deacetylase [Candidatus Omnitrophica bacterium]|nr:PIG-L family deacetylase [Candidatus Omnitrophota bacterium]
MPGDRILILAPHPDDEILGCGGVIQKAGKMGLPLKVVFLTYGDSNQWSFIVYRKHPVFLPAAVKQMGLIRHDEALEAAKVLGLSPEDLIFLGYPDFTTLQIWTSRWDDRPPARGTLSHARAVPYQNAYRPGAPYKADEILRDITDIIREFRPTKIFVSHPADHNPDHRSLYLFTRVALWGLEDEIRPEIYPYLVHFKKWPTPYGYRPDAELLPPALFAHKAEWHILPLSGEEVTNNYSAIQKHRSQYEVNKKYLLSFIRRNGLYGDFSAVRLRSKEELISLVFSSSEYLNEFPDQLLDEERAEFVGVEKEFLSIESGALIFTLRLSRPLQKSTGVSLYLFGYRKDASFTRMPKIHIKFGMIEHKILDQNRKLPLDSVHVERKGKEITMHIPLKLLGDPERILTSARTYAGALPLDWVSWRVLEIQSPSYAAREPKSLRPL